MKKSLFLFLFISQVVCAQELDSLATDTPELRLPKHILGAYVQASINVTPNPTPDGLGFMKVLGAGFKYDKLEAGFSYSIFDSELQNRLVFPKIFNLIYQHGGGYVSYSVVEFKYFDVVPFGSLQQGDMVWENSDTGEDFLREKFSLLQFGVSIQSSYLKYVVRPALIFGYQSMSGLDLSGVSPEDFKGVFVGFNVKVGYFNQ